MTTVTLTLRHTAPVLTEAGEPVYDGDYVRQKLPFAEVIDLDRLSPRARTLAEARADAEQNTVGDCGVVWMESDRPRREWMDHVEVWCTPEQADEPERRPWRGWAKYPATSSLDPHDYLEREAEKIPPGWHVYGARPDQPAASYGETGMTSKQVLAFLRDHGRRISASTWSSYVARGQAPAPSRRVGRTPLWDPQDIAEYAAG